jgi:lysophospholipase L1-like esterase
MFDLHAAIPYHSMPEAEREEIWDDGLHFTPKGYERMGELVAARLLEILEAEKAVDSGDEVPK